MSADHFFIPPPLRENEEEFLWFHGLEKGEDGVVFNPLHPLKTLPIQDRDIVAGSLKIEPYIKRKWPNTIRPVAGFKRSKEDLMIKDFSCATLTPKSFLASLPAPYTYIGGHNSCLQAQVIHIDCKEKAQDYICVGSLHVKKTTFEVKMTLRVIERELVEESFLVNSTP